MAETSLTTDFDAIREFVCGVRSPDQVLSHTFRHMLRDAVPKRSTNGAQSATVLAIRDGFDDLIAALRREDAQSVQMSRDEILDALNELEKLLR